MLLVDVVVFGMHFGHVYTSGTELFLGGQWGGGRGEDGGREKGGREKRGREKRGRERGRGEGEGKEGGRGGRDGAINVQVTRRVQIA